jgi:anion-transporting  ArsA/GET3 family ATPase
VERATEEYLASQLRARAMVELLVRSRAFHHFAAAAPGLAELVTIGKIWTLATELEDGKPVWDLLVVDCPATGHGLALLQTAGNVETLAGSGPIREQAARIQQVVSHPRATGVAIVARPEELPVSEAIEAAATLRERGLPVALAILNAMSPRRFDPGDAEALERAHAEATPHTPVAAALAAARADLERREARGEQADRLAAGIGLPVVELPELVRRRFDITAISLLADALEASGEPALAGPA